MMRMDDSSSAFILEFEEVEALRKMIGSMSKREVLLYLDAEEAEIVCDIYSDAEYYLS